MATDWVIDASIACKLLKTEADSDSVVDFLVKAEGPLRLLAPGLLRYEVGQACLRNKAVSNLESLLNDLCAAIDVVDPRDVVRVAQNLSYYDAAYLALAIEQKAGLLTADEKLRKAAAKHRINVGP